MTTRRAATDSPAPRDTRGSLIRAAEQLFAARGVDGVSLNEINRAAGQRNPSALQYHFSDRAGLLQAVLDKHNPGIDARRDALLQQCRGFGTEGDLSTLAAALVLPPAAKLADPDGGRAFLRITAELLTRPVPLIDAIWADRQIGSITTWRRLLEPLLPPESTNILHTRFTAIRFCHVELAARAAADPRPDDRLFTTRLVDLVTALLAAPVSQQTARLLEERGARKRPVS
ncbi:TetR/AcrR family transcriptional regulator [Peterkaempfera sp. SMS 1(5)a]|uniref:TetR/AcrR family transcriptional regulator n=1 Tax=Peterkaempfera podocarpi TaxID=3232308 RepID=UPI0036734338